MQKSADGDNVGEKRLLEPSKWEKQVVNNDQHKRRLLALFAPTYLYQDNDHRAQAVIAHHQAMTSAWARPSC